MNIVKYLLKSKTMLHGSNHYQSKKWSFEIKHKIDEKEIRSVLLSFEVNKQIL